MNEDTLPQTGGSYTRCPDTGDLNIATAPEPAGEPPSADPDAPTESGSKSKKTATKTAA